MAGEFSQYSNGSELAGKRRHHAGIRCNGNWAGTNLYGATLQAMFNPARIPDREQLSPCCAPPKIGDPDPRSPDIVVIPNVGVVYTGNLKKQSEHGGFAIDDTNVMLLVSNAALRARTDNSFVETAQVAPTILKLLGLNPAALDAVRLEGTPVLPGLAFGAAGE